MSDVLDASPYDALLLLSFGGPEGPDDVVPFLENVTRGRGIPKERLKEVGQHYFQFGGVSPINDQNRALLDALRKDFAEHGLDLPVHWGNRNWAPYLTDTLRDMVRDGRRRILVLATSAYASYSGCRQYRENLADALATLEKEGLELPKIDKLRHYFNHPGFVEPMVDGVIRSLADLPEDVRDGAHIAFCTHSIPTAAADTSGPVEAHGDGGAYVAQHLDVARLIADAVRERTGVDHPWQLVYQSRSGAPHIPWLEPDICDHLEERKAAGVPAVVMAPIGFVSDHMEVLYDLDTEATAKAEELGLPVRRSATVGDDPRFAAAVRELVVERAAAESGRDVTRCALGA
ncbi:ferrochelatase, partial [Actinospica acidiphila]